jgi:hypothetical protein
LRALFEYSSKFNGVERSKKLKIFCTFASDGITMYGFLKKYPNIKEEKKILLKQRRIQEKQLKGIAAIASKTASNV